MPHKIVLCSLFEPFCSSQQWSIVFFFGSDWLEKTWDIQIAPNYLLTNDEHTPSPLAQLGPTLGPQQRLSRVPDWPLDIWLGNTSGHHAPERAPSTEGTSTQGNRSTWEACWADKTVNKSVVTTSHTPQIDNLGTGWGFLQIKVISSQSITDTSLCTLKKAICLDSIVSQQPPYQWSGKGTHCDAAGIDGGGLMERGSEGELRHI